MDSYFNPAIVARAIRIECPSKNRIDIFLPGDITLTYQRKMQGFSVIVEVSASRESLGHMGHKAVVGWASASEDCAIAEFWVRCIDSFDIRRSHVQKAVSEQASATVRRMIETEGAKKLVESWP